MKNLKLTFKLSLSFGIVLVLMAIIVFMSALSLRNVATSLEIFYTKPYGDIQNISFVEISLQEMGKNMLYACISQDADETLKHLEYAQEGLAGIETALNDLKQNHQGEDVSSTEEIIKSLQTVSSKLRVFSEYCKNNDNENAFLAYDDVFENLQNISNNIVEMKKYVEMDSVAIYEKGSEKASAIILFTIVSGLICIAIGMFLSLHITNLLTKPIKVLKKAALEIAQGDFSTYIDYESKDEIGELSNGVRSMSAKVKEIIADINYVLGEIAEGDFMVKSKAEYLYAGDFNAIMLSMKKLKNNMINALTQINQSSDQVTNEADQVSSGSQALSQGAVEQADSIEKLVVSMNNITLQISENAENAEEANGKINNLGNNIQISNQKMKKMIHAMEQISSSSNEINKIIKTIEDIAFQTNILALNAAVEAARAGEAGKGFAVVAEEVRNLAGKSGEAANNTTELIKTSLNAVREGSKITEETAATLELVVSEASDAVETVNRISEISKFQAVAVEQINQGIEQISDVVQTNSSAAEQSATISQELASQAQLLKNLIGRFRIGIS